MSLSIVELCVGNVVRSWLIKVQVKSETILSIQILALKILLRNKNFSCSIYFFDKSLIKKNVYNNINKEC